MIVVDRNLLDNLSEKADASPRLRMNHNFHPDNSSQCHRLLNAIQPGSYIRPHRHLATEKDEAFVLIRGKLGIICFNDNGQPVSTALLTAGTDRCIADIPHGIYHTAVALEPGTIFFEAKAGPYLPFSTDELPDWAPLPDTPEASAYLEKLCSLFTS